MRKVKISPSLLDQFRVVQAGLYNAGPERIREYILGDFQTSPAMSRGTAYHAILEHGPEPYEKGEGGILSYVSHDVLKPEQRTPEDVTWYEVYEEELDRTWVFSEECAAPAIRMHETFIDGTPEAWGQYETVVDGIEVLMRMRFDSLQGLTIDEYKTTGSKKTVKDYRNSMQWRCYLLGLPEAHSVRYHVFQLPKLRNGEAKNTWCRPSTFELHRNRFIKQEVENMLREFLNWLKGHRDLLDAITIN